MKHSLVEPGHLPRGVGVIARYEVLVSERSREGGFIIEKVYERVFGKRGPVRDIAHYVPVQYHSGQGRDRGRRYIARIHGWAAYGALQNCRGIRRGRRETEGHRLSDAVRIHRLGELETSGNGNPVLGTFLNFDPSVMTCVEFGDDGGVAGPVDQP